MNENERLIKELEEFKAEKEKIRRLVGQIGGIKYAERDKRINLVFLIFVGLIFFLDILRHLFHIEITSLPPILSLEVALMLVSIKIVWMIHKQTRIEHFQFHILNSIEFRLNELSRQFRYIDKQLRKEEAMVESKENK